MVADTRGEKKKMTLENVLFYVGGTWDGEIGIDFTEQFGQLTTDHAASSYGQPVAVIDGQAYGPGDVRLSAHETWRVKDSVCDNADFFDVIATASLEQEASDAKALIAKWIAR